MNKFLYFIRYSLFKLNEELLLNYFNKVNQETGKNFNSILYLGEEYNSLTLLSQVNEKKVFITSKYLDYIMLFDSVKAQLDANRHKFIFTKSCFMKILGKTSKRESLFPSSWIEYIYSEDIQGSDEYKNYLSKEEEKEFTEFINYLIGLKVIMND